MNGWVEKLLSEIADINMGQSPDSKYYTEEEQGMPFIQGCAEFTTRHPKPKLNCTQIKKVAKTDSILFSVRAPVGRINIADRDYVIGRGLASISAKAIDPSLLEKCLVFREADFRIASQGSTFEAINSTELSGWPIRFPEDPLEQQIIAKLLSQVERAIEQTESLIAKQQRIKTGLMQDLLTKGIDEHGNIRSEATHAFKDSPLGRIPVEWNVRQLGEIAKQITSGSRGWASYYNSEGAIFLRIGNLTREHINLRLDDLVFVQVPESSEGKRTSVREGDLLISITADLGIIGVISKDFSEAYVNQHIALVRLDCHAVYPRFVGHLLNGFVGISQIDKLNESGAKAGLNLPTVAKLLIVVTKMKEQERIAELLDTADKQIERDKANLRKLVHQKTGLMHDLLTGKRRTTPLLAQTAS
ncbi:MAG: restriction endonuclease subunit S [Nitrosomonas sp.]|uniref:restriction endonuclease subunit S n=1 Tax=Nitrosomonas sp. TaxID=42353 RepID=UPI001D531782|nr:restriction endonuclease subunit S [Nitrosomonas sp.]MBX9895641.1 restriction endonuclease subunit S [Nitrosomonas sp.]